MLLVDSITLQLQNPLLLHKLLVVCVFTLLILGDCRAHPHRLGMPDLGLPIGYLAVELTILVLGLGAVPALIRGLSTLILLIVDYLAVWDVAWAMRLIPFARGVYLSWIQVLQVLIVESILAELAPLRLAVVLLLEALFVAFVHRLLALVVILFVV